MVCLWFITIVFLFYLFNLLYELLYSIANLKSIKCMENKINSGGGNSPILKSALPILVFSLLPIPGAIAGNISSVDDNITVTQQQKKISGVVKDKDGVPVIEPISW